MAMADKIEYYEQRARQERETAANAHCEDARRAHLELAAEHDKAAEHERARLARLRTPSAA